MDGPCVAIDFETSGNYKGCACAIGLTRIEDMQVTDHFYSLIRPPSSEIWYTRVHGLTWNKLKNAPTFEEVWPRAAEFIAGATYLVAHNASFDRRVLRSCCEVFYQEMPEQPFLCTLKGSKRLLNVSSYSLDSVCGYFGIELQHHQAASDANGCALVYLKLLKRGISNAVMRL